MPTPALRSVVAWWTARQTAAAAALYAALAAVLFGEALLGGRVLSSSDVLWSVAPWTQLAPAGVPPRGGSNPQLADAAAVFQPFLQHTRAALPEIPLWNPHIGAGRPFLANAQSAIFSPFSAPSYVLPFWWSLGLLAALKTWVAAFGGYLLGRCLGMRFGGALLAGLAYGLAPFLVVWIAWPLTSVWAWLPWLLALTEAVVRRPGALPAAGLAAVVALQFVGGHPESSFHVLALALAFLVARLAVKRRREGTAAASLARSGAAFAAALAAGTALAGAAVAPFVELLAHSGDISERAGESLHVDRKFAFALLLGDYWGRPTATNLDGFAVQKALYVGALPLMLAIAAVVLRPSLERWSVAAIGAVALAVVLGIPPVFELVTALPGFATVHNTRLTVGFVLAVALLAGWGLDDIATARGTPARRRAVLALAAALTVLPALAMLVAGRIDLSLLGPALDVAWGFATPPPPGAPTAAGVVQQSALLQWLVLAGAGLALLAARVRGAVAAGTVVALALSLVSVDLLRAGMGQNPAIPRDHAEQPATGALRHLQAHAPARFAGVPPATGFVPLAPDLAMRHGLFDARSYDYPVERRYQRLWQRWISTEPTFVPFATVAPPRPRALRALGMLSVADLLQDPADPPLRVPGLELAYDGPDARIYRNAHALPRAFLAGAQLPVAGEQAALTAIGIGGIDLSRVALVERPVEGVPIARGDRDAPPPPGRAELVRYEAEQVTVATAARHPAILVLTDLHYPGWKASVDGEDVEMARVDYLLRGVRVPAGAHEVAFRYEPASWRIGLALSLVALAGISATALAGWRRRRRA